MSNTVIDSIREKLSRILTYKNQIKTEAIAKGAEIDDTTTLREYPEKIAGISVSSNTETYYLTTTSTNATYLSSGYVKYDPRCFRVILDPSITSIYMFTFSAGTISSSVDNLYKSGSYISPYIGGMMGYIEGQNVSYIGSSAFYKCGNLRNAIFPNVKGIGASAFYSCSQLESVSFPLLSSLPVYGFYGCWTLSSVYTPLVTTIPYSCFCYCSELSSFDFTRVTVVQNSAFYGCSKLSGILSASLLSQVGYDAFCDTAFEEVNLPNVTTIGSGAFTFCKMSRISLPNYSGAVSFINYCSLLTEAWIPKCTAITKIYNTSLSEFYAPVCSTMSYGAFSCTETLQRVHFGALTTLQSSTFASCTSLAYARFDALTTIGASTNATENPFYRCYNLISLYLLGSEICSLSGSYAFISTPIRGYSTSAGCYGSIYVRASLVDSYKSKTNWTYFSSRFVGLTDEEIEALPY